MRAVSAVISRLSVRDNLRLGSYLFRGQSNRDEPLDLVFQLFPRLQERLEQRAETLSGGEQQMLAISRALMTRPRLLMLDEPSQGIMPKLVDEIFQAVKRIRDAGMTVLIVEQRMSECLEIADRAYILQTGRVLMQGSAADIRSQSGCAEGVSGIVRLVSRTRCSVKRCAAEPGPTLSWHHGPRTPQHTASTLRSIRGTES